MKENKGADVPVIDSGEWHDRADDISEQHSKDVSIQPFTDFDASRKAARYHIGQSSPVALYETENHNSRSNNFRRKLIARIQATILIVSRSGAAMNFPIKPACRQDPRSRGCTPQTEIATCRSCNNQKSIDSSVSGVRVEIAGTRVRIPMSVSTGRHKSIGNR